MYENIVREQGQFKGHFTIVAPLPHHPADKKKVLDLALGIVLGYALFMMRAGEDGKPPPLLIHAAVGNYGRVWTWVKVY
jgi:hypothetical protein